MNKTKEEKQMWDEVAVRFSELYNRGPILLVKTQKMFPNCSKYNKCCNDDKSFWDVVDKMKKAGELGGPEPIFDNDNIPLKKHKIPEGFKGVEPTL